MLWQRERAEKCRITSGVEVEARFLPGAGFALVFDSKEAVLESGRGATSERYGAGYDQTEARRIMAEEGGMRVVSFAEFAGENPGLWEQAKSLLR